MDGTARSQGKYEFDSSKKKKKLLNSFPEWRHRLHSHKQCITVALHPL